MESQREAYKEEAYELLGELESSLLALDEAPKDQELIGRVFRALHTIKGSGAMFGFDAIAAFTHEVETAFDLVRGGKLTVTKSLVDLTLAAADRIRSMLDASDASSSWESAENERIIQSLKKLLAAPLGTSSAVPQPDPAPTEAGIGKEATYRIRFRPHADLFLKGTNPLLLLNELRELGEAKVFAHTDEIPELEDLNPEECLTSWDVILTTGAGINAVRDVFIFVEDDVDLQIEIIDTAAGIEDGESMKKLGEILIERGYISKEEFTNALKEQKRIGEILVDGGLIGPQKVEAALIEQQHVKEIRNRHQTEEHTSSIRVPADRLDTLVNLVGELVTVQARLSQTVESHDYSNILSISEEIERLTAELRDNTMVLRMLPIGMTFSKFKRLVRDLSRELGKEIELVTEGAETELDKTVIERLNDPLVHLIRNCIDHGIERPEVREASGKPRQGTILLSATHSGANVMIRIVDDGAGLDVDAIRARAIERRLMEEDADLPDKEIFSLIFAPGFSTAKQVTSVSGRGVGMDVVKRSIDALRGTIEVDSRRGEGVSVTLKLPLTLAIIDGLLVEIGNGFFVLPLSVVKECVELTREDAAKSHGRHITYVRGEIVPYIRLRERFHVNGEPPAVEQIVITETAGGMLGFVVDKVIGEHQTVIKSLGKMYRNVEGISGATILGDGTVALIMDVNKLAQEAEMQEQKNGSWKSKVSAF